MLKTLKFDRGGFWHILPLGNRLSTTLCKIFIDDDHEFTLRNVSGLSFLPATCPACRDVLLDTVSLEDE